MDKQDSKHQDGSQSDSNQEFNSIDVDAILHEEEDEENPDQYTTPQKDNKPQVIKRL